MEKHFVTFLSPGIFVAEQSSLPIDSWNVDIAILLSKSVLERYDAVPYGFYFSTRERGYDDLDSREISRSGIYFLGGEVVTLQELIQKDDPADRILISNMKSNGWNSVVVNTNSWTWTQPLGEDDVVLDL